MDHITHIDYTWFTVNGKLDKLETLPRETIGQFKDRLCKHLGVRTTTVGYSDDFIIMNLPQIGLNCPGSMQSPLIVKVNSIWNLWGWI